MNLDLPIEEMYAPLLDDYLDILAEVYDEAINEMFGGILGPLLKPLSDMRGQEEPAL